MKLKKLIAAAMVGSLAFTAPIIVPNAVQSTLGAQAEAAKGGARISPKATPKAAPKASEGQSSSGKSVSGNGNSYAPSKNANQLEKNAPAANSKANAANAATPAKSSTGWGNTLRNIGLLAGGMMLGGLLASLLGGMGSGLLADILGVLVNVAIAVAAFMVLRWLWNRFRSRKEEENVYQRAEQPPITDIRPQGSAPQNAAPMDVTPPTSALDAGDSPRAIADRYRSR
ncbi:hypothetical protein [Selenomonas sp. oral taxon 136]|uniref:hypothetical protein n=1 Tax=Selenomonas sp. oral taxon 136 TaxID=713030 RepID=UPI000767E432|nr:hypothetical protein [Selenomonas sp. oral taxon 136]AME03562.1 hypothetical protein AXE86_05455 [Selenomonas sp. oral taxon 136]